MRSDSRPDFPFVDYRMPKVPGPVLVERGKRHFELMNARRSCRAFAPDSVPREAIEWAIRAASTAPSGAHRQPWRFVAIEDVTLKREIRIAAEAEEKKSYEERMPDDWLEALAPFGTTWEKPFLEIAPWLVVVFEETSGFHADGRPRKNYYVKESVGIACGLFISALHQMGLCTLTHTPSPMGFLRTLLRRPDNEKPYILFPIGFPAADARVPDLARKPLDQVAEFHPPR
ncbi:MAG: nitroreductase family protein [Polyangiaceae bacterium]